MPDACQICDKTVKRLPVHIRFRHDLSVVEYNRRFGGLSDVIYTCEYCGDEFYNPGFRKTCSKSCKHDLIGEKISGEKHPLYGTTRPESVRRKISEANVGRDGVWEGVTGEEHPAHRSNRE